MASASAEKDSDYDATFVAGLYHIFFNREPDPAGFEHHLRALREGTPPHALVASFLESEEFSQRRLIPQIDLPDLHQAYPEYYEGDLYLAVDDDRIDLMEKLIKIHRYYDQFGVWSSSVDDDKLNMADLVSITGAKSCLEIGCFNGSILSVLYDRGVDVTGVDLSHLAFVVAFSNIRNRLLYGDLLSVRLERRYDCILLLDILEHLNPLRLDRYIERLRELLNSNGIIIMNSPMFGSDDVFGTAFEKSQQEWRDTGDRDFYRHWPCDAKGWPTHGHMIWASPDWWTRQFEAHDLVRLGEIENTVQHELLHYFSWAPARKSLFLLSHRHADIDRDLISEMIKCHEWR